ncbi:MAG: hypothetical protein IKZ62_00010 [Prevotella sp.]|nr:hypothetical protein [Prevotella sp.]
MNNELRERILSVLLFCQANKGDLSLYDEWCNQEDAEKKLFYAYYSGLFCRILWFLESDSVFRSFVRDCNDLLDKYNWYNIQDEDLKLYYSAGPTGCEVPDALEFIDGVDNVLWKDSGFKNESDAVCLKTEQGVKTFADVRGSKRHLADSSENNTSD